jgi:hypothetical protein
VRRQSDPDATVPDGVRSCESRQVLGVADLADDLESGVFDGESA